MTVHIQPMPAAYRSIKRFRPNPPPIFPDGPPSPEDIAEAQALFAALDPESRDWYAKGFAMFRET